MKTIAMIMVSAAAAVLLGISTYATAAEVEDYSETIEVFRSSPAVAAFFDNSYGYAVFPTIGKAGWVVGGSYGQGQVYRNGEVTGKTRLIEGSIGFQLGAKAFREIIFFQDWSLCTECEGDNPDGYLSFDVDALLEGGNLQGHVYATHCGSLNSP